jgi:hypothetical protein
MYLSRMDGWENCLKNPFIRCAKLRKKSSSLKKTDYKSNSNMKIKYNKEKDEEPKKNSDWFVPNKEYCALFIEKNKEGIFFGIDTAALHPYKIFDVLTHFIPYKMS